MSEPDRCHCGRPLHYTNPETQARVEYLIRRQGPAVNVQVGERVWRVPRHYIALHGLKAAEIDGLGFEELDPQ